VVSSPLVNGDAHALRTIDVPTSHADLVPTLLGLAGIDARARAELAGYITGHRVEPLPGADLSDVVTGRAHDVVETDGAPREAAFFATADAIVAPVTGAAHRRWERAFAREVDWAIARGAPISPGPIRAPWCVEAVRAPAWKYARTFGDGERDAWELYSLDRDPAERHNLLDCATGEPRLRDGDAPASWGLTPGDVAATRTRLHAVLTRYRSLAR
ncbi:MAG: hypothetical protein WCJ30_15080, partial [Deltaproteobacteria bacterium]